MLGRRTRIRNPISRFLDKSVNIGEILQKGNKYKVYSFLNCYQSLSNVLNLYHFSGTIVAPLCHGQYGEGWWDKKTILVFLLFF